MDVKFLSRFLLLMMMQFLSWYCSSRLASSCEAAYTHAVHPPPLPQQQQPAAGGAAMNPSELEALFQVMEAFLDLPNNFRMLHPRPCTEDLWQGMLCEHGAAGAGDKLMHVTRLQFGSGMRQRCRLGATIPGSAMSQLPYLRTLLISECIMSQRSTIPGLELPASLQELSLRSNKALVGAIPAALGRLKGLQVLSLAQNNLQGSVPAALGGLKMLEHLDLSYNVLSGSVPPVLGQLSSLSILDLSGNLLQGSIPSSFAGLKALQKLDLSSNQLKGAIPTELGSLRNLQFLALSQNGFTGPLPASLASLSNLEYFLMDSNPVHGSLPSYLMGGSWTQLRELSVADAFFTGPIPSVDLHALFNISVINLSNNKLDGAIPPSLEQLSQLSYLNLSQNFFTGPVPFSAPFLHKLSNRLDLHGNPGLCVSATALSFSADLLNAQQLHPCDSRAATGLSSSTSNSLHRPTASSSSLPPRRHPLAHFIYAFLLVIIHFFVHFSLSGCRRMRS